MGVSPIAVNEKRTDPLFVQAHVYYVRSLAFTRSFLSRSYADSPEKSVYDIVSSTIEVLVRRQRKDLRLACRGSPLSAPLSPRICASGKKVSATVIKRGVTDFIGRKIAIRRTIGEARNEKEQHGY